MTGGRHGARRGQTGADCGSGRRHRRRGGAEAEPSAARIRVSGGQAAASALDVCDRVAVDAMVAAVVREFGRLDIVLESAGISHRLNFLEVDAETWDRGS